MRVDKTMVDKHGMDPSVELHLRPAADVPALPNGTGRVEPALTHFVVYIGVGPGGGMCDAACAFCYLASSSHPWVACSPATLGVQLERALETVRSLRAAGYGAHLVVPDVFGGEGAFLESEALEETFLYDQDGLTGEKIAWTSGVALARHDGRRLLALAAGRGYRVIALTCHGIRDGDSPFTGVTRPSVVREVMRRIHSWNEGHPEQCFGISLTFPLTRHDLHEVRRHVAYSAAWGARYVRFNRFIDFSSDGRHRAFVPEDSQIRSFYAGIAELSGRSTHALSVWAFDALPPAALPATSLARDPLGIMISTDMGWEGEELLGEGVHINRCPGGTGLFGVVGDLIYPCPELLTGRPAGCRKLLKQSATPPQVTLPACLPARRSGAASPA